MKKIILFICIAVLVFFISAWPLFAFTTKSEDTVDLREDISDDIYISGRNISVSASVEGDLVAAGGQMDLSGAVLQDLIAAGGLIEIGGTVGDDIKVAGGNITIRGKVNDDVVAAGGQVTVDENSVINGDLVIAGGMLDINGEVKGKVIASGGQINISGRIGNGVEIESVGSLRIEDGAEISGNLNYTSTTKAVISDSAKINGEIKFTEISKPEMPGNISAGGFAGILSGVFGGVLAAVTVISRIILFLSMFIVGILLLLAFPKLFKKFTDRMKKSLGMCVAGGAIMLFGTPLGLMIIWIVAVLLIMTLIGAGTGMIAIAGTAIIAIIYFVLIYVSTSFLAFFIGELILSRAKIDHSKYGWKVLSYFIGLVLIMLVYAIPFVGGFAGFAGILFGFGGIVMIIKDSLWNAAKCAGKK